MYLYGLLGAFVLLSLPLTPLSINGNNQIWFRKEVFYNTSDLSEANTPQLVTTDLCVKGYGYAMEGKNPTTPTDKILITNREFKVSKNSKFIVPILIDETVVIPSFTVSIDNVSQDIGTDYLIEYTLDGDTQNAGFSYGLIKQTGETNVVFEFDPNQTSKITTITFTGSVDVVLFVEDTLTGEYIESNTFNLNI